MRIDDIPARPGDTLDAATTALRETPIPAPPPAEVLLRIEKLPATLPARRTFSSRLLLTAASIAGLMLGLFVYFQLQRSSGIAFGEVVQAMDRTHTFTGKVDFPIPASSGIPAGMHFAFKVLVKGQELRAESAGFTIVADQNANKLLVIVPLLRQAISGDLGDSRKFDLYGMLREYHTGTEKQIGEKTIGGRKTVGFQLSRAADLPGQSADLWTFWVDPTTKSPVQIDLLERNFQDSISITDLQFDVPLDDALFDMKVPAGYALTDTTTKDSDPWDRQLFSGQVADEHGKPVAGVEVSATSRNDPLKNGSYDELGAPVRTDRDGRFTIDAGFIHNKERISIGMDFTGKISSTRGTVIEDSPIRLEFKHPDFVYARLEDLRLMPPEQRVGLHVRLRNGTSITGRVLDAAGNPVGGVMLATVYGTADDLELRRDYRKVIQTDATGKFEFRGLAPASIVLQARKFDPATPLWGQVNVNLMAEPKTADVTVHAINIPEGKNVHELFGMKLLDIDAELQSRLSLPAFDKVLILDPGPNMNRLGIGQPQQGDAIWMVNEKRIKDFDELASELLQACQSQKLRGLSTFRVQLLYDADRPDHGENGGGYIALNADDLAELQKLAALPKKK